MGRRWNQIKAAVTTAFYGVPTNYGSGTLTDGTAVTYLRGGDGVVLHPDAASDEVHADRASHRWPVAPGGLTLLFATNPGCVRP